MCDDEDIERMRLGEFLYTYLEAGGFDHDRTKTIAAWSKAYERIPREVWDELPFILVLAPSAAKAGEVFSFPKHELILYLSPTLENENVPQEEADFTVAHEIAHIFLNHDKGENKRLTPKESR